MEADAFSESLWVDLRQRATSNPAMAPAEPLEYRGNGRPYTCAMVSRDGSLHLLIDPESPLREDLRNPAVAGLRAGLLLDCLVIGRARQTYIDVRCDSQQFRRVFTVIAKQIALAILRDMALPSVAVNSVIDIWRRFWLRQPTSALSEDEQLGLIGELTVLERLYREGVRDAVLAWGGPLGSPRDFELRGLGIEVKSTCGTRRRHQVNNIRQLERGDDRVLLLVSLLAQRTSEGGISLPERISLVAGAIQTADEQEVYYDRLAASGYTPAHDEEYAGTRFVLTEPVAFIVDDDFPRITPDMFCNALSSRVYAVHYGVDRDGLRCFQMPSDDFTALLRDFA